MATGVEEYLKKDHKPSKVKKKKSTVFEQSYDIKKSTETYNFVGKKQNKQNLLIRNGFKMQGFLLKNIC